MNGRQRHLREQERVGRKEKEHEGEQEKIWILLGHKIILSNIYHHDELAGDRINFQEKIGKGKVTMYTEE